MKCISILSGFFPSYTQPHHTTQHQIPSHHMADVFFLFQKKYYSIFLVYIFCWHKHAHTRYWYWILIFVVPVVKIISLISMLFALAFSHSFFFFLVFFLLHLLECLKPRICHCVCSWYRFTSSMKCKCTTVSRYFKEFKCRGADIRHVRICSDGYFENFVRICTKIRRWFIR